MGSCFVRAYSEVVLVGDLLVGGGEGWGVESLGIGGKGLKGGGSLE